MPCRGLPPATCASGRRASLPGCADSCHGRPASSRHCSYRWKPSPLLVKYPSLRVALRQHTVACEASHNPEPELSGVDCDKPAVPLQKIINSILAETEPDIFNLWQSWFLSEPDINHLLSFQTEGGGGNSSPHDAACEWLKSDIGSALWRPWVEISDVCVGRERPHSWDSDRGVCVPAGSQEESAGPAPFPWLWLLLAVTVTVCAALAVKVRNRHVPRLRSGRGGLDRKD